MTCIDTQRLIMSFINNKLDITQLEEFVNHVNSCSDCMEELEVYYVLLAGMKQLDEDRELSTNFHNDLMNLLRRSEDRIFHAKILHIRKVIILSIVITFAAFISSFRIGEIVVEDVLHRKLTESNYTTDNLFRIDMYETNTEIIQDNLSSIYVYLVEADPKSAKRMEEYYGKKIWEGEIISPGVGLQLYLPDQMKLSY